MDQSRGSRRTSALPLVRGTVVGRRLIDSPTLEVGGGRSELPTHVVNNVEQEGRPSFKDADDGVRFARPVTDDQPFTATPFPKKLPPIAWPARVNSPVNARLLRQATPRVGEEPHAADRSRAASSVGQMGTRTDLLDEARPGAQCTHAGTAAGPTSG